MTNINTRFQTAGAVCASILFLLLGASLVPFAGVQEDEALFGVPLFLFKQRELALRIFHRELPLMVMSYVGTLKTLIYALVFRFWHVNVWSVRLPMVCAGALTVFVLYKFTSRAAGAFAGLAGAFFLATDPTFIVTNTFDWGPVALGHLLLVTGCFFLLRFSQEYRMRDLALGFFFLGLGLWNKALMFWVLGGLVCGAVVFWPELKRLMTRRNVMVASAAFVLGALPFIIFNLKRRNATLEENFHVEPAPVSAIIRVKLGMVQAAMNGSGLFGFIPETDFAPNPHAPVTRRGRFAEWIRERLGQHERSGFDYAFLLALLAVPWWWRVRGAWFALIFMIVTWMAMAITKGAGGAIHHSVLLWPFPQFFVATVLASIPWRRAATAVALVLVAMNLLVVNEYLAELDRNGAAGNFSDALFRLYAEIPDSNRPVYVTDWGIANTLSMFHEGHLVVRSGLGLFQPETPTKTDREIIKRIMEDPDAVFIGHVQERETMKGVNDHADREAALIGRRKQMIEIIDDSHGRPVFEVFRFVPKL